MSEATRQTEMDMISIRFRLELRDWEKDLQKDFLICFPCTLKQTPVAHMFLEIRPASVGLRCSLCGLNRESTPDPQYVAQVEGGTVP